MLRPVRRVVTGHDGAGRSVILSDGASPHLLENPDQPGRGLTDLWRTDTTPARNDGGDDAADTRVTLSPPSQGSVFRFFQIMPEREMADLSAEERQRRDAESFARMGAAAAHDSASGQPGMHKTDTVDYIVLLSGRVTMILDDGEVDLQPLDVVVQRGTNHAWVNRGDEPAVLAGVLIDALPL
ncbi:MAG: cupin domain-containing protein [Alphaproteobacteria bacterium]|jgi:mannose-6-phosphate isomerase-like protein (cupin superfamily)|nr:cupin domain-containing protein [Alphaproteobacteria bacterium]MDP6564367.1 cupin domain-containing protein [Alphaproteobacteria bacterium]MDP6812537.1 cupin domain-containing protein [Alphaproteobacteria bacterium]